MKNIIFRLTLPLTIISFGIFTKWSYGLAIDAKDVFFYGFPLIYKCEAFHTSGATQYFIWEMTLNLLTYFVFWLFITLTLNRIIKINIPRKISKAFWIGFAIIFAGAIFLSNSLDDQYLIKRNFDVKIFDSGFTLFESNSKDWKKYQTKLKNWDGK